MKDYLNIGSSPYGEDCAQLNKTPNYETVARRECEVFKQQIRRELGDEPRTAKLRTKSFPHDFGDYFEVIVEFEDTNMKAVDYAFLVEGSAPERWDNESMKALGLGYSKAQP